MIKKYESYDIPYINKLLNTFDYKITEESIINNKFLNIIIYNNYEGVLVYNYIYDRIEIEYIIVDESYRRKGIATKLMNYLIDNYKNIKNISLEVRESNLSAIKFYEKLGFKKECIRKNYYGNENGILMIKKCDN